MGGIVPFEVMGMDLEGTRIFISTADARGTPHIASAGDLVRLPAHRVSLRYWFCPQTIANLQENPQCSVVIWNIDRDDGYQLVGKVIDVQELGMLDGYRPADLHEDIDLPQVKYGVTIEVGKVLEFRHAPHADTEIGQSAAQAG